MVKRERQRETERCIHTHTSTPHTLKYKQFMSLVHTPHTIWITPTIMANVILNELTKLSLLPVCAHPGSLPMPYTSHVTSTPDDRSFLKSYASLIFVRIHFCKSVGLPDILNVSIFLVYPREYFSRMCARGVRA